MLFWGDMHVWWLKNRGLLGKMITRETSDTVCLCGHCHSVMQSAASGGTVFSLPGEQQAQNEWAHDCNSTQPLSSVSVSWSSSNTLLQIWWLKTTELYSLTVLETRSPKSRCQQGGSFWSREGELDPCLSPGFLWLPTTLGIPWLRNTFLQSLSLTSHSLLPCLLPSLL